MGRKRIPFDDHDKRQIIGMAAAGLNDDEIAAIIGKSCEKTIQRNCRVELDKGRKQGKGKLKLTAFRMATSGKMPAMTIFLCKVWLGWRERDHDAADARGPETLARPEVGEAPTSE